MGKTYSTHLNSLIILQKKIIRIITFSYHLAHTPPLYKSLKILPLDKLYQYSLSLFAYKLINLTVPPLLHAILTTPVNTHSHYTRTTQSLPTFFFRHRVSQIGLKYNLSRLYNSLPVSLKDIHSFALYKHKIKLFLIDCITV
jgi:hypothetical protein